MLTSNQKGRVKKFIVFLILLGILLTTKVYAVVTPTTDFYVNDYADLLSKDTKSYIMQVNQSLQEQTGAQIVVVTIPSLEGASLEEYATTVFRNFGIGDRTKNNGLLLLLSLKERKFRVEVGYGLEGILPDAKTGRIQDEYMIPYLKENQWDEGIKNGFNAFLEVIVNDYGITINRQSPNVVGSSQETNFNYSFFSVALGICLGMVLRVKRMKTPIKWLISILYLGIFGGVVFLFTHSISASFTSAIINSIILLFVCFTKGGYWFIGGGRPWRRIFWRWTAEASREAEVLLVEAEALEVFKIGK